MAWRGTDAGKLSNGLAPATSRLVLGAAQLGMPYGIANCIGPPDPETAVEMVSVAHHRGVRYFDTAQDYGVSETVLGNVFTKLDIGGDVLVVSKLGKAVHADDRTQIMGSIAASLSRLRLQRLWGLFLHQEEQLTEWPRTLGSTLLEAKEVGRIGHVGVSVYTVECAMRALAAEGIDSIQVACNVFDRRMRRSGVLDRARVLGKSIFVRSIYLQGLALLEPQHVPERIFKAAEAVNAYKAFCQTHGLDRGRFAVDHVRWMAPGSRLVIGAESVQQVINNCEFVEAEAIPPDIHQAWDDLWPDDHGNLIDPRVW